MKAELFIIGFLLLAAGQSGSAEVQTGSTLATTPGGVQAPVSPGAAAVAGSPNPGNTKVNLTLNIEGVTVELDNLTISLSGLRVGIEKLTLIAEVDLPPLLPQLGEVVGGVGKTLGPATQALTSTLGPITKTLGDTTGKLTGGGKKPQPDLDKSLEEMISQPLQHYPEHDYASQSSVDPDLVSSNPSNDQKLTQPKLRPERKKSRFDWVSSMLPSFY